MGHEYLLVGPKGAVSRHAGVECGVDAVFVMCAESIPQNHSTGTVPLRDVHTAITADTYWITSKITAESAFS